MKKELEKFNLFGQAWKIFKRRWKLLIVAFLVPFGLSGFAPFARFPSVAALINLPLSGGNFGMTQSGLGEESMTFFMLGLGGVFLFLVSVAYLLISIYFGLGYNNIALSLSQKEDTQIEDLYPSVRNFANFLIGMIVYSVLFAAFSWFVVALGIQIPNVENNPGILISLLGVVAVLFAIWVFLRLIILYPFVILDQSVGPFEAFKETWMTTSGALWGLIKYVLVVIVLSFFSVLFVGLPFILVLPLMTVTLALIYQKLKRA